MRTIHINPRGRDMPNSPRPLQFPLDTSCSGRDGGESGGDVQEAVRSFPLFLSRVCRPSSFPRLAREGLRRQTIPSKQGRGPDICSLTKTLSPTHLFWNPSINTCESSLNLLPKTSKPFSLTTKKNSAANRVGSEERESNKQTPGHV